MLNVGTNQHRWKLLDERVCQLLEEGAEELRFAWAEDKKYPKSYPLNTDYAFSRLKQKLAGPPPISEGKKLLRPPSPPPQKLSELVNEKTVKAVYELQSEGSYEEALVQAAAWNISTWRKIWRAVNAAYMIDHFGTEFVPKPKVQFLHRELLEVLDLADLELTPEGILDFLDDVCPCGKKHTPDAIRKLRKRVAASRPKSRRG